MADLLRIKCPDVSLNKNERVDCLFQDIREWLYSDALINLVEIFGGKVNKQRDIKSAINNLHLFANIWDYRKKQAAGGERWKIYNDSFVEENSDQIMKLVGRLGLKDITRPLCVPDYILPLGGARLANLSRSQKAKSLADSFNEQSVNIVALGGMRPLDDIEKEYTNEYAPYAGTEYDAINRGLELSFNLQEVNYVENGYLGVDRNANWSVREYKVPQKIFSVAAPSFELSRRANSMDTFNFFIEKFNVEKGTKLLLVTSCIYVPFQFLKFMSIALDKDLYIDCVGVSSSQPGVQFSKTSNYLQETKATIDAMKMLADKYL